MTIVIVITKLSGGDTMADEEPGHKTKLVELTCYFVVNRSGENL
jgi:hypothetical protein